MLGPKSIVKPVSKKRPPLVKVEKKPQLKKDGIKDVKDKK